MIAAVAYKPFSRIARAYPSTSPLIDNFKRSAKYKQHGWVRRVFASTVLALSSLAAAGDPNHHDWHFNINVWRYNVCGCGQGVHEAQILTDQEPNGKFVDHGTQTVLHLSFGPRVLTPFSDSCRNFDDGIAFPAYAASWAMHEGYRPPHSGGNKANWETPQNYGYCDAGSTRVVIALGTSSSYRLR